MGSFQRNKMKGELICDQRVNRITVEDFLREMWEKDSKVWNAIMEELYIYDFKLTKSDDSGKVFTSKLRMYNFEVPLLNLPDSCEQTTSISFMERTHKSIKFQTSTQADKFPFANTFEIIQTYDIEEDPLGVRLKIYGHVEWVKPINFMIKPAIKYNVTKNLKVSGDIIINHLQTLH